MATKNPPRAGRYSLAHVAYACAFPRRPCDIGGGSGPGSPDMHTFRYTVAGQRRPLTGFPC